MPCCCSNSNDILNKFLCLVCTWFQYLYLNSKDTINVIWTPIKKLLTFFIRIPNEIFTIFAKFMLGNSIHCTQLTQICCININIYFLEKWQFNHNLAPPFLHTYQAWKTVLTILTKYESKWNSTISIFQLFSELGEIWKYSLNIPKSQKSISFMN